MRRAPAEIVYIVLAGVFGLTFLVTTPPFESPDEGNHFLRALQLSEGRIIGEKRGGTSGGTVPSIVYAETHAFDRLAFHPAERTSRQAVLERLTQSARWGTDAMAPRAFEDFPNTVRYSPVPYLPEIAAIELARALGLTIVATLYLSRLFCLTWALGILWLSLRLLPDALKWSFAGLALLPMCLFVTSMASPDAFIISVSFLAAALAVWLRANPRVRVTQPLVMLAIGGCVAGLALSKVAYFLVPAAIGVGLSTRLESPWKRAALIGGFIAVSLVIDLCWLAIVEPILTPPRQDPGIDSAAQLRLVLHDPMVFVRAATFDLSRRALHYYDSFIGKLGYLDVILPRWVLTCFTALLALVSLSRGAGESGPRFTPVERVILAAIPAATFVLTMFLQYLDWVTVGGLDLRGVLQGRHYYPVAPLLLIAVPRLALPDVWRPVRPVVFAAGYSVLLAATALALARRYYG